MTTWTFDEYDEEIRRLIDDPAASNWVKLALTMALDRDPIDAVRDAEIITNVLQKRATQILAAGIGRYEQRKRTCAEQELLNELPPLGGMQ